MEENKSYNYEILLEKGKKLLKDYSSKDSSEINILNIIDGDTLEWSHSKILNILFSKIHIKNERDNFLTLFLKRLEIENIDEDEFLVEREYRCNPYGQMDFKIENKNLCVVLEMKIYAEDGSKQLRRYEKYCLENKKNYKILYLTLDGHKPSNQSIEGFENKNNLKCISFKEHILPWLKECLNLVKDEKNKSSFILQYIAVIENLIEEEKYRMADLIKGSKDAKAIIFLYEKILKDKMQEILKKFLEKLGREIKKNIRGVRYKELKNEYYNRPTVNYFLDEIEIKEKIYRFNFGIEPDKEEKIVGCFEFFEYDEIDDKLYWLEFEKIKKIDKEFFSKWNEKIENLLVDFKIKNLKNDRNGYKYFYLTDKNGKVVDFKDFSENSIALSLIDNIDKEVEKFSKIIIEIIRKLKNK